GLGPDLHGFRILERAHLLLLVVFIHDDSALAVPSHAVGQFAPRLLLLVELGLPLLPQLRQLLLECLAFGFERLEFLLLALELLLQLLYVAPRARVLVDDVAVLVLDRDLDRAVGLRPRIDGDPGLRVVRAAAFALLAGQLLLDAADAVARGFLPHPVGSGPIGEFLDLGLEISRRPRMPQRFVEQRLALGARILLAPFRLRRWCRRRRWRRCYRRLRSRWLRGRGRIFFFPGLLHRTHVLEVLIVDMSAVVAAVAA